ncbi:glycoprotein [Aldersonia kunmingensis]|uniref:glycoprotein n=1 Tax=Aldersonia kunmingensis TaxID=408066 RepID=UPI00083486F2
MRSALILVAAAVIGGYGAGPALASPSQPRQPIGDSAENGDSPAADQTVDQDSDESPEFLALSIDSVAPTTVTPASSPYFVVEATVRNVGDRTVSDVDVRIQRGDAIAQASGLRTSLQLDQTNFEVAGEFVTVAEKLAKGQSKHFRLTIPLRAGGVDTPDLDIQKPGVYPMLLNVNGTPEYGDAARLDDARFLLPVLGLPPVPTADDPDAAKAVAAPTDAPVAMTMLWPLADRPRIAAGQPGSLDQPIRLVDDGLATSLASGGRLDGLVAALEYAIGPNTEMGSRIAEGTCLAIDPDLLVTVSSMTRGYLVVEDPADPTGPAHEGAGAAAATQWLDRVRALAGGLCTVALPFAQVDVVGLETVHNEALEADALDSGPDVVDRVLGITSVRGVVWPDSGSIDDDTAEMLDRRRAGTVLLASNAVTRSDEPAVPPDVVELSASDTTDEDEPETGTEPAPNTATTLRAAPFDVFAATALAAVGTDPQTPSFTPARMRYDLDEDSGTARLQDALGALTWTALTPQPNHPRSVLFAPPQMWTADRTEAGALLAEAALLMQTNLANPRGLSTLLGQSAGPQPFETNYVAQAVRDAVPDATRAAAGSQAARIDNLNAALVDDPQRELTPTRYLSPVREDLLRAMSLSGRRDNHSIAQQASDDRIDATAQSVEDMYAGVTILAPGGVYTLASEQSPLLLVARNDLPVGIRVLVDIDAPAAMSVTDLGEQQLPASGSRTLQVPAKASDSINMAVDVALTTPAGVPLGTPTTVSVRSNAYGPALAIVTGCAGGLLLLLAGRRLWHRFRGQPDPADDDYERR